MSIEVTHTKVDFTDERGDITRVLDVEGTEYKIKAVLRITHKKDSPPRGNHYHKKDYHWVYVEEGMMRYYEKPFDEPDSKPTSVVMKKGDLVLTHPGIIHAMEALEDTVFWAITTEGRDQKKYEGDTVRINIT
ncbi:MAG: Cupin 2 conserved barrel domain protein [Candidatus Woesebacteria bacterium GW2011_GWB1_38_5b]|uniref:Cupin 2 conserved barrel domain protein n=1 Tax=Candidatus Woesebacteria bacterium GW2011_GWB1_38_5b TaxID=1618569 RepID=A0A0G0NF61_9BACT|nr:MAG: Cupin 2 conserved barrel domain protein [Candidatus Woesebacteria bacterium GW2011_GWB1_38_5b]